MRRRDVLAAIAVPFAGCGSRPLGNEATTETNDHGTDGRPEYAGCDASSVPEDAPESATPVPDPLTEKRVEEYVEMVERDITLPPDDEIADGYVAVGTVSVEAVEHGYVASVPVNGGYYNSGDGDATETTHYDLPTHEAQYFLSDRVVRRAEGSAGSTDPRMSGEVVACDPD